MYLKPTMLFKISLGYLETVYQSEETSRVFARGFLTLYIESDVFSPAHKISASNRTPQSNNCTHSIGQS